LPLEFTVLQFIIYLKFSYLLLEGKGSIVLENQSCKVRKDFD